MLVIVAVASLAVAAAAEADTPERAVRSFYVALEHDDGVSYSRLTSSHFYAFDAGKRLSGTELLDAIKSIHASGTVLKWDLGAIDVHVNGSSAWAAWQNHGAAGKAGALQPVSWLESATLHHTGRRWQLEFLHSNRVEPAR